MTDFFNKLVPHLTTTQLEIGRIHRALGRPPQEDNPRDLFADIAPATVAKRRSFKPITAVLQQYNIKYRWAFPFRLHFTHRGKQYSVTTLEEATELIQQLQLKQRPPNPTSTQEED
ncbi:hypothetical protein XELAEV_18028314mg [Xenopus laevis]|uniref:Uncharacterized protein n=1 Tax=Xenopus laevis TaxID=8355 RepID=A0A974CWX9_XENLA|nr:hypothetical protein XELAEV_18028314mg [Xenopus laevis]